MVVAAAGIYSLDLWYLTASSILKKKDVETPPPPRCWPKVSVHLPFYNERRVARRILEACSRLDYPRKRLEIIVVDDSNDGTTTIVKGFMRETKTQIRLIHRNTREGFKAGALQRALEASSGDVIAIFDADFIPPTNFLKRVIPYLYMDDRIAFVQARWTYIDGEFSWYAKAISLAIDIYNKVDQIARYLSNLIPHFNGTCAVFKKEALLDAGGWKTDTLAEDLDLSIRLKINGWRHVYLPNLEVPGEIPPTFKALKNQQYRWARGFTECLKKHWRALIAEKKLTLPQRLESIIYLATYTLCPISLIGMGLGIAYAILFPKNFYLENLKNYLLLIFNVILSSIIYTAPLAAATTTIFKSKETLKGRVQGFIKLIYLAIFFYTMLLNYSKAVIDGLLKGGGYFIRTPKIGRGPLTIHTRPEVEAV
jgi:cellulose synthase/poly-beta-1,6-N-acetylglucosamine synthase-like glycosyltransferase